MEAFQNANKFFECYLHCADYDFMCKWCSYVVLHHTECLPNPSQAVILNILPSGGSLPVTRFTACISTCLMIWGRQQSHRPSPLLEFPPADVFFLFYLFCHISPPQRQAKYSENKLKCTKARNDYLLNLAATNAVVAKYYIHDVSDMIDVSMSSKRVFASISQLGSLMLI